ncbi:SRPBCC domain-containing protein [Streptomyces sp. NBRC 109706]|uniref:SRPBCC domain-containing protein n=1 Tax=Streptomyces sp. NBRC 109706 TaxID=1550035 RepID=UPI0007824323|nr:SRPBCC domain-containing protein [Streptomyces sp. NBRC 109706]
MAALVDAVLAVRREARHRTDPAGDAVTIALRRSLDATQENVWHACVTPERLVHWLGPVTGDIREDGAFQLEGGARGKVLRCARPGLLQVSWVDDEQLRALDADDSSEVTLRLSAAGYGATLLELEHTIHAPAGWDRYGPGVAGIRWDLGLLGLARHLAGRELADIAAFPSSPEGRTFVTDTSQRWRAVHAASGAPAVRAREAAARSAAFFLPEA